jgi:hypothetical protein
MSEYYKCFDYGECGDDRIKLLMEIVLRKNLSGRKCALNADSVHSSTIFFLQFLDGSGVIPLSCEKRTSEVISSVYYLGLIEKKLNIDVVALVTDRCTKIVKHKNYFKIDNQVDLVVIDKAIKLYCDPYHLYKSFMRYIINKNLIVLTNFFERNNDFSTINLQTYEKSYK